MATGAPDWQPLYKFLRDALSVNVDVNLAEADASYYTNLAAALNNLTVTVDSAQQQLNDAISKIGDTFGTIETVDRVGSIYYADGFESGIGTFLTTLTAAGNLWVSRVTRKTGLQSLCIYVKAWGDAVKIEKRLPFPATKKLGIEVSFCQLTFYGHVDLYITYSRDGVQDQCKVRLRWDLFHELGVIHNGAYVTIVDLTTAGISSSFFNTFKVVYDFSARKYVKLIWDGISYDISARCNHLVDSEEMRMTIGVYVYADSGTLNNTVCFLDDIILTEEV